MDRVFIKYCVFFPKILEKVCYLSLASTRLLLVVQKITSKYEWLYTRIALRALKVSFSNVGEEGGSSELWKKSIFPEHPVVPVKGSTKLQNF